MPFILRKDAVRWRRELRETFILATPLILGQLSSIGMNVIDTLLAGHLDARTLAAVAIGTGLWSLAIVAAIGVMLALQPSVAQLSGAGQRARIGALLRQALWLAFALGLVLLVLVRNASVLLGPIGIDPAIAGETRKFLHAIAWGAPALTLYFALRGFSEGIALTRPTMYFGLLGLLLLAPIGYVLMYGRLGLPRLGAQGSGMATAAVLWIQVFAFALYLRLRRHYREIAPFGRFDPPDWQAIVALLRLGVPMGVAVLMEAGLFVAAALLIGSLGAVIRSPVIRLRSMSHRWPSWCRWAWPWPRRCASATPSAVVTPRRFVRPATPALPRQCSHRPCLRSTMALFPLAIANIYTDDHGVGAMAAQLLLLAAILQFSDGVKVTANGALRGLKDTTVPMAVTALAYWGIGMPVGYWLAFGAGFGARGMWMGLIAGLTVAAALLFLRFARRTARLSA